MSRGCMVTRRLDIEIENIRYRGGEDAHVFCVPRRDHPQGEKEELNGKARHA